MLAGDLGLQLIERNIEILRDVKSRDEFALVARPVYGEFIIMPPSGSEITRDNALSIDTIPN